MKTNDRENDSPTESVPSVRGGSEWDAEQMSHSSDAQRQAGPGTSESLAQSSAPARPDAPTPKVDQTGQSPDIAESANQPAVKFDPELGPSEEHEPADLPAGLAGEMSANPSHYRTEAAHCDPKMGGLKNENSASESTPSGPSDPQSSQGVAPSSASQLGQTEQVEGCKSNQTGTADSAQKTPATILDGCQSGNEKAVHSDGNDSASRVDESTTPAGTRKVQPPDEKPYAGADAVPSSSQELSEPASVEIGPGEQAPAPVLTTEAVKDFPIGICNIVSDLAQSFCLERWCLLLPCLGVVGAAAANWAKARSPILSGRMNPALQLVICDEPANRLSEVLDLLLDPLRQYQDARLGELNDTTRKVMQKEIERLQTLAAKEWLEGAQDSAPDRFGSRIAKLQGCLRPMRLIEDPEPGQLLRALRGSIGPAVTVVYHTASLNRLLDCAKGEGAVDLNLLQAGYLGRTFSRPSLEVRWAEAIVQPAVSAFIVADRESLGRMYENGNPAIQQFAAQLVLVQPCELSSANPTDRGSTADALGRWHELISGLLDLGESGTEFVLDSSPEAPRRLADFRRQQTLNTRSSNSQEQRFLMNMPIVADKLELCCELASATAEQRQPVSASLMDKSIRLAEERCKQTASLAGILAKERGQAHLEKEADKMWLLLDQMGISKPWPLWKRYNRHPKKTMKPILDYLILTGRVRRHPDGTVQTVSEGSDQVSGKIEPEGT